MSLSRYLLLCVRACDVVVVAADMRKWIAEGKIEVQETFFHGIEAWGDAFGSLFTGANLGKVVLML